MLVLFKNIKHIVIIHSGKGSALITLSFATGGKAFILFFYLNI